MITSAVILYPQLQFKTKQTNVLFFFAEREGQLGSITDIVATPDGQWHQSRVGVSTWRRGVGRVNGLKGL